MRSCYCYDDYYSRRMLAQAFWYAMTEYYIIFRKPRKIQFLLWTTNHEDTVDVRMPKRTDKDYTKAKIDFKKECVGLIDLGYTYPDLTEDVVEDWRKEIAEYLMEKNEVWE